MSLEIKCPSCGEEDRAKLEPSREGERIMIHCQSCDTTWERETDRCPGCGARGLVPRRVPLLQKARGTQQSIVGYRIAKDCLACGWSSTGPGETSAV